MPRLKGTVTFLLSLIHSFIYLIDYHPSHSFHFIQFTSWSLPILIQSRCLSSFVEQGQVSFRTTTTPGRVVGSPWCVVEKESEQESTDDPLSRHDTTRHAHHGRTVCCASCSSSGHEPARPHRRFRPRLYSYYYSRVTVPRLLPAPEPRRRVPRRHLRRAGRHHGRRARHCLPGAAVAE